METQDKSEYRQLEVYKRAWALLRPLHELTLTFPEYEKQDLATQIRRACKSIPASISKDYAKRRSAKEFATALNNALISALEMELHLEMAVELGYVTSSDGEKFGSEYAIVGNQLFKLIQHWGAVDRGIRMSDQPSSDEEEVRA